MTDSEIVKMMRPVMTLRTVETIKTGLGQYLNKALDSWRSALQILSHDVRLDTEQMREAEGCASSFREEKVPVLINNSRV